jgi:hypothetical protein
MVLSKCITIGKRGFIRTLTANNLLTTITGVTVQLCNKYNNGHECRCESFHRGESSGLGILSPFVKVRTGHAVPRGPFWHLSSNITLLPRVKKRTVYIVGEAGHVVPASPLRLFLLKEPVV